MVKISHPTVNPQTEYRQFIINQLPHCEISRYKAKKRVAKKRVANLGGFPPKKQIYGFFGNS
jgi:hypothetical protein